MEEKLKRIVNEDGVAEFVIVDKNGKILRKYGLNKAEQGTPAVVEELKVKAQEFVRSNDISVRSSVAKHHFLIVLQSMKVNLKTNDPKRRLRRSQKKITGRVTVEVLDDESSCAPSTARSTISISSVKDTRRRDDVTDAFSFSSEKSRVSLSQDSFIPCFDPKKSSLEKQSRALEVERQRLDEIQRQVKNEERNQSISLVNRQIRAQHVEHELAATKIQSKVRQRKATMLVNQKQQEETRLSEQAGKWIMVRNEADEVWYHNVETQESQWEAPAELSRVLNSRASTDRFPTLPASPATSSSYLEYPESNFSSSSQSSRLQSTLPPLSPDTADEGGKLRYCITPEADRGELPGIRNNVTADIVNEWNFHREEQDDDADLDDGGVNAFAMESNLFLADGSKSGLFKKTIREQLKTSRFHSITQLLASQTLQKKKPTVQTDAGVGRKVVLGRKAAGAKYMIAKVSSKKSSKKKNASKSKAKSNDIPRVREVDDPGLPINQEKVAKKQAKCLGCFIKGKACTAHAPKGNHMVKESDSVLLCDNWDVGELRRKYRAEELQELFQMKNPSLRYNRTRKQWTSTEEFRHPIYRYCAHYRLVMNRTVRRRLHVRAWFKSFLDILRTDRDSNKTTGSQSVSLMRVRTTMRNFKWCHAFSESVTEFHPKPPVTKEILKPFSSETDTIEQIYVDISKRPHVKVLPTEPPPKIELYRPRKYVPGPRQFIPMPEPSFSDATPLPVHNKHIDGAEKISWFERLIIRTVQRGVTKALYQITACVPSSGGGIVAKTSHPKTTTVKFAAFDRKTTPENKAVGGLSAELTIHMIVTTYVPPQFGDFRVTNYAAVNPGITRDCSASFECLKVPMMIPVYIYRALEHPLNIRRPPCLTISTCAPAEDRYYHGLNRPEQTGEEESHGFQTTEFHKGLSLLVKTIANNFTPTPNAMTPNLTETNQTTTTHADRHYPFCEPSTKANTVSEFIHLLWVGKSSRNQGQCFTNLGRQEPGEFMRNSDPENELGPYTSIVYRSWAYMQSSPYEEFVTDNGIAYWYDRDKGKTYWERPVLEIERQRGVDGGVDGTITDGIGERASLGVGVNEPKYSQKEMRTYITKTIEEPKDEEIRKKKVKQSAKKHDVVLPDDFVPTARTGFEMPKLKLKTSRKPSVAKLNLVPIPEPDVVTAASTPTALPIDAKILQSIQAAIGNVLEANGDSSSNMLQLGIGLGMGLGLQQQQQQLEQQPSRPGTAVSSIDSASVLSTERSDISSVTNERPESAMSRVTNAEPGATTTPTPDEMPEEVVNEDQVDFYTHDAAGKGTTWVAPADLTDADRGTVPGSTGTLHRSVARLPEGFVDSISTTRCVPMQADYLPRVINMNEARCVGIVHPRRAADEWIAANYNPWSAGNDDFATQMITNLIPDEEEVVNTATTSAFAETEGHAARAEAITGAARDTVDLETIMSLCRHGKYDEIEEKLNSPDWTLPIDAKDAKGNTLLSIACQNDKRRILKLCLRKGADINTQNINGQTPLHFCHAYNFTSLADYLMGKGADDTIVNADNLTCYEGLNADEVENI